MAEHFSTEGLDSIINFIPRNTGSALPSTLFLAAITTVGEQTHSPSVALDATKVPSVATVWATDYQATVVNSHGSGGEPTISTGGYTRVSMANSTWGAPAANAALGERTTATQQSFPQSTAAWSNPTVVGFALVTSASAAAGIAYFYANFDDGNSVAVNASNIVLQVTPYWELDY